MLSFSEFLREEGPLRIRLGGSTDASKSFLRDYHDTTSPHPFSRGHRLFGHASLEVSDFNGKIRLHDVQTHVPRSGAGTAALKHLTGLADKHGVAIHATAKAYSKDPTHVNKTDDLKKWYRKHGFQVERGTSKTGYDIRYDPRVKESIHEVLSQKQAEEKFQLGHCRSFAHALHSKIGGEIRGLKHRDREYHVYVHKDGHDYDVKGRRSTASMALGLTGSTEHWSKSRVDREKMKVDHRAVKHAHEYIDSNKKKFGL